MTAWRSYSVRRISDTLSPDDVHDHSSSGLIVPQRAMPRMFFRFGVGRTGGAEWRARHGHGRKSQSRQCLPSSTSPCSRQATHDRATDSRAGFAFLGLLVLDMCHAKASALSWLDPHSHPPLTLLTRLTPLSSRLPRHYWIHLVRA